MHDLINVNAEDLKFKLIELISNYRLDHLNEIHNYLYLPLLVEAQTLGSIEKHKVLIG